MPIITGARPRPRGLVPGGMRPLLPAPRLILPPRISPATPTNLPGSTPTALPRPTPPAGPSHATCALIPGVGAPTGRAPQNLRRPTSVYKELEALPSLPKSAAQTLPADQIVARQVGNMMRSNRTVDVKMLNKVIAGQLRISSTAIEQKRAEGGTHPQGSPEAARLGKELAELEAGKRSLEETAKTLYETGQLRPALERLLKKS